MGPVIYMGLWVRTGSGGGVGEDLNGSDHLIAGRVGIAPHQRCVPEFLVGKSRALLQRSREGGVR